MERHDFDIEIRRNGEVKVHIKGVKGKACLKYMDLFKQIVGEVKQQQLTHEAYEPDTQVKINTEVQQQVRTK